MSEYPKPPFDTTMTWIEDTFDPDIPPETTVVDLNDLSTEELLKQAASNELALKIVVFRLTQENQKG